MNLTVVILQLVIAGILAVAAIGKLMDLPGSRKAVNDFGVPREYADPLGTALPFGELSLAALLLFGATARLGALGALLLFLAFIAGIGWNLRRGRTPDCHCFGELHSSPAGWRTIIRNVAFAAMALVVVIGGGRSPIATVDDLSTAAQAGLWLTLLILGVGAVLLWALDRIGKQQARIRADIEALQTASLFAGLTPATGGNTSASTATLQPSDPAASMKDPVGDPAPPFDLPTLDGRRLTLGDLLAEGKPSLLLFTAPSCGYCTAMYPEVVEWSKRFGAELGVVVVGRGEAGANREKLAGFEFPHIVIDEDAAVAAAYDAMATPSAVIVLPNGTILGTVAGGRQDIQKLVGRTLRERRQRGAQAQAPAQAPAETPAVQTSPAPAANAFPAPSFEVATPDGGTMSLDSLLARGKPVLVLFWSTGCGFCTRFAPEVGEWYRRFGNDVTIAVLTSAGDEGIREQAAAFGFEHVGLQESREVMQQYGASGTPSAVLIQHDGWVENDVAGGAPNIRHLIGKLVNRVERKSAQLDPVPTTSANGAGDAVPADPQTQAEEEIRQSLLASLKGPEIGVEGSRLPWATLDGDYVGLDDYRGRPVVLVFWGVDCEFSQRMLPDLKEWEAEAGNTVEHVLIISSGDVDANRAQGLRTRVVLDDSFSAGSDFGVTGTPAAVRLDAQGRVDSRLAVGADAVLALLYDFSEGPVEAGAGRVGLSRPELN